MKLLKLFGISLIVLFLIIWLFSLLIPSHVRISRATDIYSSTGTLDSLVKNLRNWESWNVMLEPKEPDFAESKFYPDSIIGPTIRIVKIASGLDTLKTSWVLPGGRSIEGTIALHQSNSDQVIVQWYFDFHLKWYPWEKFGSIIFDKQLGPSMENSLDKLKKMVEAKR